MVGIENIYLLMRKKKLFLAKFYEFVCFFSVETSDGSKHQEVGDFKYVGGLTVRGSYEFIDETGQVRKVKNIIQFDLLQ